MREDVTILGPALRNFLFRGGAHFLWSFCLPGSQTTERLCARSFFYADLRFYKVPQPPLLQNKTANQTDKAIEKSMP
jgi:hypothetical protein